MNGSGYLDEETCNGGDYANMDEPNSRQSHDEMSLVDRLPWMNLWIRKVFLKLKIQEFMAAQDSHTLTFHSVTNTCL